MFSGLVREIASVVSLDNGLLRLSCAYVPEIGDSIAVNGMCLTAVSLFSDGFALEVSEHSAKKVAIENYANKVHIEPALRADSRLDGHFVQGHIDGIGVIESIDQRARESVFTIQAQPHILLLAIPQGSITIDGISLTISSVLENAFTLTIIPHTMQNTLFAHYKVGRRVNIESDVLVRSLAHIIGKLVAPQASTRDDSYAHNSTQQNFHTNFQANFRKILESSQSYLHDSKHTSSWSELDSILMRY